MLRGLVLFCQRGLASCLLFPVWSSWQPLLDILPQHFRSSLLVIDDAYLLKGLRNTELLTEVVETRKAWHKLHDYLSGTLSAYKENVRSYSTFRHARLNVLSRVHALGSTGPGSEHTFVPFLDLLNHEHAAPTRWHEAHDRGGFVVQTSRAIAEGAPITTSYGDHRSNKDLLLHHDFVPAKNPSDWITLKVSMIMEDDDALYTNKRSALLAMDVYRSFEFSEAEGFAASGLPLRSYHNLTDSSLQDIMFDEVLILLRLAVLGSEDLARNLILKHAVLEGQHAAIEQLRSTRVVVNADLESRAAARLEQACNVNIALLGEQKSATDLFEELLATKAVQTESKAPDLQYVATTIAAYLAGQRRLHVLIREVAQKVQKLVAENSWPHLFVFDRETDVITLVRQWARLYSVGLSRHEAQQSSEL